MLSISIGTQFVLWNLDSVFENLAIDYGIGDVSEDAVINFIGYHYFTYSVLDTTGIKVCYRVASSNVLISYDVVIVRDWLKTIVRN